MDGSGRGKHASERAAADATHVDLAKRGKRAPHRRERVGTHVFISQTAARQRGLVTRKQLLEHGVDHNAIDRALRDQRLYPVFRGVYAVLPVEALPALAREHAAVLACSPNAYLSHQSAAAMWRLQPASGVVHITVVGRHAGPSRPGLVVHHAAALDRRDTRIRHGLPVTAPARAILDLTPSLTSAQLERVFDEALHARIMRRSEVVAMLERHRGRPGTPRLAALAHEDRQVTWTRADTERRLIALLAKARLPVPEVNVRYGPYELDFYWRDAGLVVETDGYEFHSTRRQLERDHARDLYLQGRGLIVARFSWRQVRYEPEMVIAQIATLLAQRRAA